MKIYISGPMSGKPNLNFSEFDTARDMFLRLGYEVVSPADLERQRGELPYLEALRDDLKHLLTCQAIFMLKGWQRSHGAKAEWYIANLLGFQIFYE
jgi:hypothetical protein